MAQRSTTAAVNMALYYALLSFFSALYFQAQGTITGAMGPSPGGPAPETAAEFVVLREPMAIPERLLRTAATAVGAANATDPDTQMTELMCLECDCCLKNTSPRVCLTTCCCQRVCGESVCSIPEVVSCGCNHCVPAPPHHSHRHHHHHHPPPPPALTD